MKYRKLIAESWEFTQENKDLIRWFGFLPAIFTTGAAIIVLIYQFYAFSGTELFELNSDHSIFKIAGDFIEYLQGHKILFWPIIAVAAITIIGYLILPTLAKAAAIQRIANTKEDRKIKLSTCIKRAYFSFLPLFEYHLFIKTFSLFSILLEMAFVIRNLGIDFFLAFLAVFIIVLIAGIVMTLFFTYTDFYIVLDNEPVFSAIQNSSRMVLVNWRHTFLVTLLMIIIGIRIVIQAVVVLLIPVLVVLSTGYLATIVAPSIGLIVGVGLGLLH